MIVLVGRDNSVFDPLPEKLNCVFGRFTLVEEQIFHLELVVFVVEAHLEFLLGRFGLALAIAGLIVLAIFVCAEVEQIEHLFIVDLVHRHEERKSTLYIRSHLAVLVEDLVDRSCGDSEVFFSTLNERRCIRPCF